MAYQIQIDINFLVEKLKELLDSDPFLKFEAGLEQVLEQNLAGTKTSIRLAVASRIREITIEWRFERMRQLKKQRTSRHSVGKIPRKRKDFPLSGKDRAAGEKDVA